jgi:hypothetical protein
VTASRRGLTLLGVLAVMACTREVEVRATYANIRGAAAIFPCDQPNEMWHVRDTVLAAAFQRQAPGPMFVRLRGVRADSGSIYGARHFFEVRSVVEARPRQPGECPAPTDSAGVPAMRSAGVAH